MKMCFAKIMVLLLLGVGIAGAEDNAGDQPHKPLPTPTSRSMQP